MKKILTLLSVAFMLLTMPTTVTTAQTRRPGQTTVTNNTTRPGQQNTRPGNINSKPNTTGRPATNKRPGTAAARPGTTNKRPAQLTPPSRPNRLPSISTRPAPVRPSTLRPGTKKFSATILGLTFGTTLSSSLDYLYNSKYNIDGYGSNHVYLRNVKELNYIWTDATLTYQYGKLSQSVFYESTIGYDTSRYYSVFNQLRALYGSPATRNTDGRNMTSVWWSADGSYISIEFALLKSSGGYRYFTILTIGQ